MIFFYTSAKEVGTQERAQTHMEKQSAQMGKKPAHIQRKPTQVGRELAHSKRRGIPEIRTLSNQVRTAAFYHSGKKPFSKCMLATMIGEVKT